MWRRRSLPLRPPSSSWYVKPRCAALSCPDCYAMLP
jgi:hypothetical protein